MEDLLEKAEQAIEEDLCDHCLGRLFAQLGHGTTNEERGKSLKIVYAMKNSDEEDRMKIPEEPEVCSVCGNIFEELDKFSEIIIEELDDIEFETFLVGSRNDPEIYENEEQLWTELNLTTGESIKHELNREIGKLVLDKTGKNVDLEKPDVKSIIDTRFDTVEVEIAPLFVYGRYKKLSREIPQTEWICKKCRGKGCEHCDFEGKMYPTSVEKIIGEELMEMIFGEDYTLHGMGREDINAKMIGSGRPFVIEISNPLIRDIDLDELKSRVNESEKVNIDNLHITERSRVVDIKQTQVDKSYRVKVSFERPIKGAKLKKVVEELRGAKISQCTPNRVSHRRADKVRKRKIKNIEIESMDEKSASIKLKCEAGTYVKEFIHGDVGRTEPSLSTELGLDCVVEELDVIDVDYQY
ncbi:MAG: tRNA pseudouridine(54/55) synthase Pus10 [Thermoplasmata archaeon]